MKRQQLEWLFFSLSCCSAHIPGIDWRNLLFLISLSPVLHLICYFDGLSFYWNHSSLKSYWDKSCLGLYVDSSNFNLGFHWDQDSLYLSLGFHWDRDSWKLSLEPQVWGQSRRMGGAEGFTPKSIPLGPKSAIFSRVKKGNTYATSTHLPCFLQNRSNCKTVLYLRDPLTGHRLPSSSGYHCHAVSHRIAGVSSLSPGEQIYPSFSGYSSKKWGWNC